TKKNFTALSGNDLATVLFHYLSFPCFFAFVTISEVCRLMRYRSVTNVLFRFFCSENRNFFAKIRKMMSVLWFFSLLIVPLWTKQAYGVIAQSEYV
ncbi:MAG: hypothetical protein IKD25_01500, partial [Bacteroidaceae bacterium]|nr:hypothetical protein [Bacteroidaceae bacterium]